MEQKSENKYQELIDYLKMKHRMNKTKKEYLLKRKEKKEEKGKTLKEQEGEIIGKIFRSWSKGREWLPLAQLERELINNREILRIFNKEKGGIREGLQNRGNVKIQELMEYLNRDEEYEQKYKEYRKEREILGEENDIVLMED